MKTYSAIAPPTATLSPASGSPGKLSSVEYPCKSGLKCLYMSVSTK